ncbi:hypothetical protein [Dokdonia sp.]|uniref:hypothetical protein n=1 Tax=Dokdonia sp. TaxID=2024995 RepID=UPI0032648C96
MNTKLDNITAQYRKFNENQALTEDQLNEFIDYFEDQDRLSRTRLSGTGIVCGFSTNSAFGFANVVAGPDLNGLGISQGVGVTTDGDLITLRNSQEGVKEVSIDFDGKIFNYYKEYDDIYNYPHFSELTKTSLIELRNEVDIIGEEADFTKIDPAILNGKVVLLYLESYVREGGPCQTVDCDSQGDEQVSELRVLLVSTSDAKKIINGNTEDTIYNTHNEYEVLYDALPNIEVSRAFLTDDVTTTAQVRAKFTNAIERDNIVSKLSAGFESISQAFNVEINLGGQTLGVLLSNLVKTTDTDFQYRYDLLKDVVATYNEIKNLLLHLKAICCPSIHSFPKHLMLGPVDAPLELGENTAYRHDFYKSPIITEEDENYAKVVLLTNRFAQKIQNFRKFIGPVKVTPSKKDTDLGEKAVPFYYNVTDALLETWNYEKTENDKEDHNLSYHIGNLADDNFIQFPLNYSIDDNNFFRIEGHLGQSYQIAYKNINAIKTKYGLPFNIKTLMLSKKSLVKAVPVSAESVEVSSLSSIIEQQLVKTSSETNQLIDTSSSTGRISAETSEVTETSETTEISIEDLRRQLLEVSTAFVSNTGDNQQETLDTIANLDYQLNLLNEVEALTKPQLPQDGGVTVVTQEDDEIESELLSDFMERHSGLEHFAGVEPGGTFILVHESESKGQVIADFSLPYLCCDKKDPVFLVLAVTELCEDDAPIPMTVIPFEGEIKAFDGLTQITGITTSGGQNMFDPSLVPATSKGNTISFTVNDDPVETVLTVHEIPEVDIVEQSTTFKNDNAEADVIFEVIGSNASYDYNWDFGDGQTSTTNPAIANGTVLKTYTVDPDNDETYNVVVTITNRITGCSTQKNIEIDISAPSVPCDQTFNHSGGAGDFFYFIDFGNETGTAGIDYNAYGVPDRFIIEWNGNIVADSGFVGSSSHNTSLVQAGVSQSDINTGSPSTGSGTLTFNKTQSTPTKAKITVQAPLGGTAWNVQGKCPVANSANANGSSDI